MYSSLISLVKRNSMWAILSVLCVGLTLSGCDLAKNQLKSDRGANMEIQDFRDGLAERMPEVEENDVAAGGVGIPSLQSYISPVPEGLKPMPLVSLSVNQTVPLRDVLFELAGQADYDLELDPRIRGSIIFTARDKPFDVVIKRIADMARLRYSFDDDVLRVELDKPYNKIYKIDYLNFVRTNKGKISNDISVVSGEGTDTGSNFEAASEGEADFWGELDANLQQMLATSDVGLKTKRDPRITAVDQNPDVQAVSAGADGEVNVAAPQAVLRVESLPIDDDDNNSRSGNSRDDGDQQTFSINKHAGLINVYASERAHKEVTEYLRILRRSATAQVLIEAKILEVILQDEHQTGIDWSTLGLVSDKLTAAFTSPTGSLLGAVGAATVPAATVGGTAITGGAGGPNFSLGYAGNDVQALITALSGFGTVRALASPRLTVLNNQSAVLNVATNRVFFEIEIDTVTDTGATTVAVDSDIKNVPEGVLVNVQPSINLDNGTISMAMRPTITRIVGQGKPDPAVTFADASLPVPTGIQSFIPELNVQEIDTVIRVRSGQAVVMGGLLQDRAFSNEEGIPVASEIPIFGRLFKDHRDLVQKTELVIFLKATILENPEDSVHNTDKDLYRMFSGDRRPLKL